MEIEEIAEIICNASIVPTLICDKNKIISFNKRLIDLFEYPIEEFINLNVASFFKDNFLPKYPGLNIEGLSYCSIKSSDTKRIVPTLVKSWNFKNNCFYTVTIRDLGEIKNQVVSETNEQISFDKDQISQLTEHLSCSVLLFDRDGLMFFCNKKFKEITGLEPNEDWVDIFDESQFDLMTRNWTESLKTGKQFNMELRIRKSPKKNPSQINNYRWFLIRNECIKDKKGIIIRWVSSWTDINDLKVAEEEKLKLILSEKTAKENTKLKSDFLAVMSHELRTPLFGVIGNSSLLLESKLNPEQTELTESIYRSAQLLLNVIQDILDFSRIESGKLEISSDPFNINDLLDDLKRIMKTQAKQKDLELSVAIGRGTSLLGDRNRILQILLNLVSNSIKFTSHGGIQVRLKETFNEDKAKLYFEVIDTGIGIKNADIKTLFSPWTQIISTRQKNNGSGLGLSICKSLLDLMGGNIGIKSEVGLGTIVWFTIHLPLLQNIKLNPQKPIKKQKVVQKQKQRVLVAEDNLINQKIIEKFLKKINYIEYHIVENGLIAWNTYNKMPNDYYKIVLLDQSMPLMDGDEVSTLIKNKNPNQVTISVSANVIRSSDQENIIYDDYAAKPFTFDTFSALIEKWVNL